MFSGLIEAVGEVCDVKDTPYLRVLTPWSEPLAIGSSVAVDGCCLTVIEQQGRILSFELGAETRQLTSLAACPIGQLVNLERALRLDSRLDGHLVTGHVDCVATLLQRTSQQNLIEVTIALPPAMRRYIVAKGSIAVDGISLTVNQLRDLSFTVGLLPYTLEKTTLGRKPIGAMVNLEFDIMGKYALRSRELEVQA